MVEPQPPNLLYRYFSYQGAHATLDSGMIRFSSPACFEDPNDLRFEVTPGISPQELVTSVVDLLFETVERVSAAKLQLMQGAGIPRDRLVEIREAVKGRVSGHANPFNEVFEK